MLIITAQPTYLVTLELLSEIHFNLDVVLNYSGRAVLDENANVCGC